jgi:hypothetical protein
MPTMKPKSENVTQARTMVAAAPTYPAVTSTKLTGAERSS